jgi:hypothetical protein
VIPVGTDSALIPVESVYHERLPAVPAGMLAVLAVNMASPSVPLVIVPDWAARLTVAVPEPAGFEQPKITRLIRATKANGIPFLAWFIA